MKRCIQFGGITPQQYWDMTPRETFVYLEAMEERHIDRYEGYANQAIMHRIASGKKKLKKEDLFKRPKKGGTVVNLDEKRKTLEALERELGFSQKGDDVNG